jgi:2-polyprenyl-6-methoxyphenol hydroxylase-like FAD-dependent oxidoreductase
MEPARVVIIGGGFCGAFCAAELAAAARGPVAITIVEPRPVLGAGLAYSATDPAHRVNVPAARMTLHPDNPTDFDDWIRRHGVLEADPAARRAGGRSGGAVARWPRLSAARGVRPLCRSPAGGARGGAVGGQPHACA